MKTIRAMIADDEKPARDRLRLALDDFPRIEVIAEAVNGVEALELGRELKPDLLFLDIQMPLMDGFDVLAQLKPRPAVIFVTAYDEYAIEAFEVHALDYLLKPYSRGRLDDAVRHGLEALDRSIRDDTDDRVERLLADHRKKEPYITRLSIKRGRGYRVLPVSQAELFKAENGLVFWVGKGEQYLVDETLNALENRLDPERFMRVHRNAIVNLEAVSRIISRGRGRLTAVSPSGYEIDIGRSHSAAFRKVMRLRRSST
jgi:two-component system LytT family response regulator